MDPESGIQRVRKNQTLLVTTFLTSDSEWRKFRIDRCLEEELEDNLDYTL